MNQPCLWTASPPSPVHVPPRSSTSSPGRIGWRTNAILGPPFPKKKSSLFLFMLFFMDTWNKNKNSLMGWWWRWGETALKKRFENLPEKKKKKKAIKKDSLKKVIKKIKSQQSNWKKCWREVWSSVDWRHFGTERRPHTWHHAEKEGGEGRERERRKDGMTRESWVEFMQSHSV